ncbi:hypothetical protein [Sinomonas sp. G460-2]|uniref:hypothetical protein n=1 Tax=Sinomonas sp. G460-2 TaxID=3393464 RepID=UPI0039EE9E66
MGQRTEHLMRLRRASVEALWTGRAAALAGAAVAILSSARAVPLVPVAGLVFAAAGVLMGVMARQRILEIDRELRNAARVRRNGPSASLPVREPVAAGAEATPSLSGPTSGRAPSAPSVDRELAATLWELEHEFDLRRALRCVYDGAEGDGARVVDAVIGESALLSATVYDLRTRRSWERLVLSAPGILAFLREEDLDRTEAAARPSLVVADQEFEGCVFWLPSGRRRWNPAWKIAYTSSPDSDPYMNLQVAHRGIVRIRFRIADRPEGPIRDGLWAQFEVLAQRVADAVERPR